ncbi:MAG: indole-3-glycerol phosphate synthase TrpC [Salibacteraceae bacterium]
MNILAEIIAHKRQEVAQNKALKPVKLLEQSLFFETTVVSMTTYLKRPDKAGIIAEIKRSSPSTGPFKGPIDVEKLSVGYMQAGATALSVLTDQRYFQGANADLREARKYNYCPILRKDFIVDEYQLVEAKSIGADCVLLIAACLNPERCRELGAFAQSLGLEVLLEIHRREELDHLNPFINLVGVNNRNLENFTTDISQSIELAAHLPEELVRISESGITEAHQVHRLREHGFQGFLIGGHFMKQAHPERACRQLIREIQAVPA